MVISDPSLSAATVTGMDTLSRMFPFGSGALREETVMLNGHDEFPWHDSTKGKMAHCHRMSFSSEISDRICNAAITVSRSDLSIANGNLGIGNGVRVSQPMSRHRVRRAVTGGVWRRLNEEHCESQQHRLHVSSYNCSII